MGTISYKFMNIRSHKTKTRAFEKNNKTNDTNVFRLKQKCKPNILTRVCKRQINTLCFHSFKSVPDVFHLVVDVLSRQIVE